MKKKDYNKFLIGLFIFFVSISSFSQCIEQQTLINGNQGPNIGSSLGQQFVACETGVLDKIELYINSGSSSTMKLEIYDSSLGWSNPMWGVDNIPINTVGSLIIDLTSGTGTTLNVIQNHVYSMRFWNTGSSVYTLSNQFSSIDSYPNGAALNNFGAVQDFSPNFLDFYFRISINHATLSIEKHKFIKDEITIYPNPSIDNIYIPSIEPQKIKIYDISGKMIAEKQILNGKINISDLNSGIYFLNILKNNKSFFKKIMKE